MFTRQIKLLILLFTLLSGITTLAQPLTINIRLDKEEYLTYEPIMLLIEIKNETNSPLPYNFDLFDKNFKLNVTFNGEKIKCSGSGGFVDGVPKIFILDSKSSVYYYYTMLSPFGCTNSLQEKEIDLVHLIEGDYTIELQYNFGKIVLNNNVDLVIKSNKLNFKVKYPENEVLKTQLVKYIALMKDLDLFKNVELYKKRINKIIRLDENSPYSLLARYNLVTVYKASCTNKAKTEYRKIMEKDCNNYPESFVSLSYAMYDKVILNMMADSKILKGKIIQRLSKKIKESRGKLKFLK